MNRSAAPLLHIDGSQGEGGGQVLRTALALSLCLGRPFRMVNIRAGRKKPGLRPQHLTAVRAAAEIGRAKVEGDQPASQELCFQPGKLTPGKYQFTMLTAGSTILVLQTILPVLLTAQGPSRLVLEGGTHNPMAPPFDFLVHAFLPLLTRMGAKVKTQLLQYGFYPAGGGRIRVDIDPVGTLKPLDLTGRGRLRGIEARAIVSRLPEHIALRELDVIARELDLGKDCLSMQVETGANSPGNVVWVAVHSEYVTEVFTGFGRRGVPAEAVADEVVQETRRYLQAGNVAAAEYLADQLLLPLALAGKGSFTTVEPSRHTLTNIEVIRQFTGCRFRCLPIGEDACRIGLG